MSEQAAARLGDPVGHSLGLAGMVGGAILGAAVGVALLGATVMTGGAAGVFAAAAIAGVVGGGALAGGQLVHGLQTVLGLSNPTTGTLAHGSPDVRVNGRPAIRAGVDDVSTCTGLYGLNHLPKSPSRVAEGSDTVRVNGKPAARVEDRLECAATITTGSPDTFIGGPTKGELPIHDNEAIAQQVAQVLVVVGLVGAAGLAVVGASTVGAALLGLGRLGVGVAGFTGVNEGLGWVGDKLGPGWRDTLQGTFGVGALLAAPKLARAAEQRAVAERVRANVAESQAAREASNFGGKPPAAGTRSTTRAAWREQQSAARGRAYVTARSNAGDIAGARRALEPHVRARNPQALMDRLDVSSPHNGAWFWSGNKEAAKLYARRAGGVALETTPGGRVVDDWALLNRELPWKQGGETFWKGLSRKYAQGASGEVNVIQSAKKAAVGGGDIWKQVERPVLQDLLDDGIVTRINDPIVVPDPPTSP